MTANCATCDRPIATAEHWRTVQPGDGIGSQLCWGGSDCTAHAVDWRERYLELARERAAADESTECPQGHIGHRTLVDGRCPSCGWMTAQSLRERAMRRTAEGRQ